MSSKSLSSLVTRYGAAELHHDIKSVSAILLRDYNTRIKTVHMQHEHGVIREAAALWLIVTAERPDRKDFDGLGGSWVGSMLRDCLRTRFGFLSARDVGIKRSRRINSYTMEYVLTIDVGTWP